MTSNIGVKEVSIFGKGIGYGANNIVNETQRSQKIIQKALKDKFKPEFLNRIDETIIFNRLSLDNIKEIMKNEMKDVEKNISDIGYKLELNNQAYDYIAQEGFHEEYGARPLNRAIQTYVENTVSEAIVEGDLKLGQKITIKYTEKKGIYYSISDS